MYLARQTINRCVHYSIRESYREGKDYRSRELFALGTDPSAYIVYPGGNAFYVDEAVTDRLRQLGVIPDDDELDGIFWPFVDPAIRRRLDSFRDRAKAFRPKAPLSPEDRQRIRLRSHLFDKRRIHFLRGGQMDQGNIGRMPAVMLRWLAAKSRDEIEQHFMEMERVLKPHECKTYVFVIFDLGRHFSESFARTNPQMLDPFAVDKEFEIELCRLNEDAGFWAGVDGQTDSVLHPYLRRYAVMFFDGEYGRNRFLDSLLQDFMNRRRFFRFPSKVSSVDYDQASAIFGESRKALQDMDRRELTRLYRTKARKIHPDTGGDHESFIRLTAAYQALMHRKPRG